MHEYSATVQWQRADDEAYVDNKYSRGHKWIFDGGAVVSASSSPQIVPLPYSVQEGVDPEEAFIASLSSCHMLFFLFVAAKNRFVIDKYVDNAVGVMGKNKDGKQAITQVTLKPHVKFSGAKIPSQADIERMHQQAHEQCFIANSVTTKIKIEVPHDLSIERAP
jgi:organic hydroperoxide reductase OsmC/OhrA